MAIDPTPNREIAIGFIAFVAQFFLTVLIGALIGIGLGEAILKSQALAQLLLNFFWLGQWFAVIGLWATSFISILGLLAVVATGAYYSLLFNGAVDRNTSLRRLLTVREVTLYGLMVAVLVHVLEPTGFAWFAVLNPYGEVRAVAVLLFVVLTNYLMSTAVSLGIRTTADARTGDIRTSALLGDRKHRAPKGFGVIFLLVSLVIWQVMSSLNLLPGSSPWSVARSAVTILTTGGSQFSSRSDAWAQIGMSIFEIALGLTLSLSFAYWLCSGLRKKMRPWVFQSLQFTYVTPILVVPFFLKYGVLAGMWLTTCAVFFLSFYPCFRFLWALKADPGIKRLFAASSEALPYAFVGMLFGETLHSFQGLGFAMLATSNQAGTEIDQRLGIWLITIATLTVSSVITSAFALRT